MKSRYHYVLLTVWQRLQQESSSKRDYCRPSLSIMPYGNEIDKVGREGMHHAIIRIGIRISGGYRTFWGNVAMKPKLLDLFCGAGGAAFGYMQAGFDVVGVDIKPQPRYPGTFILGDALTFPLEGYGAYHASPLCQGFTQMLNWNEQIKAEYPDYIDIMRQRFLATGKPYVIENVEGARQALINPIMLCGNMFGLRVYRHRLFESNILLFAHSHVKHRIPAAHSGKVARPDQFWCPVGNFGHKDDAQRAMGIDWMKTTGSKEREIAQAIPPAYTLWVGAQLMQVLSLESEVVA